MTLVEKSFVNTRNPPKPARTDIKEHYVLNANRIKNKTILRSAVLIVSEYDLDKDNKTMASRGRSQDLTKEELKKLAKKLGWIYRPTPLKYLIRLSKELKFMEGSVSQDYDKIRNLDGKEFKALRD